MKKAILISLLLALAAQGQQQQRIAILGTEDDGDPPIEILELTHLTDKLREIAGKTLPKNRYGIMTQQSIVDRLGSQEQAAKMCRDATCLADLGRKVNADYIAQARIGRFSGNLTIKIELYNVGSGNLIASFTDDSENVKGLLAVMEAKAPALFRDMLSASSEDVEYTVKSSKSIQKTKESTNTTTGVKLDSLNKIRFGIGGVLGLYYNPSEEILNEATNLEYDFADGRVLKIGLLLNIPVYTKDKRQLVLSPELYYAYRWIDANNNEGYYPYPMDTIMKISVVASITEHVINVPLLVKYKFLDVMPRYIPSTYLEGGVQFGFPLKTTMEDDNGYSKAYTNRNKFDFDILVGVGYGGPLGSGELFAGIRLGYSLLDFNKTYSSSLGIFSDIMLFWLF